jgi:LPXTG-motif cell wall-anchored protein
VNPASPTFTITSPASPRPSPGVIAGATVGAVVGFLAIVGLLAFFLLRRRKQNRHHHAAETDPHLQGEKAQLHSDDLKPVRKELMGQGVIKRKPVPVAEMPANESVIKRKSVPVAEMPANEDLKRITSELPANEIIGSEMDSQSKSAGTAAGTGST